MTKPRCVSINIPFDGFYESLYSHEIDRYTEQRGEDVHSREMEALPEELRVSADEFESALNDALDYHKACVNIAKSYVEGFERVWSDSIGVKLRLGFEEMTSPREYNFTTDRIFCDVPVSVVRKLFAISRADKHDALARVIKRRFTSCDGFISSYHNDLDSWLARPLASWDHNELGTLLIAVYEASADYDDEWRMAVYYATCDDSCMHEIETAIDWSKYEAEIADLRAEKAADFEASNPGFVAPIPRCENTLDLFRPN